METKNLVRYNTTVLLSLPGVDVELPDTLTPREAAAVLSVSEETVRKWCDAGRLDATSSQPGGKRRLRRVSSSSVVALVKSHDEHRANAVADLFTVLQPLPRDATSISALEAAIRERRVAELELSAAALEVENRQLEEEVDRLRSAVIALVGPKEQVCS